MVRLQIASIPGGMMVLGSFAARFNHGLLIIAAPESVDAHEDWDPATEAIHAGADSLYCEVAAAASGIVSVTCIEDEDSDLELEEIFSGMLELPSRRLQFYDPNQTIRMVVPVSYEKSRIQIYADALEEPDTLVVRVTNALA